jgi:hypothetical protein
MVAAVLGETLIAVEYLEACLPKLLLDYIDAQLVARGLPVA